MQNMPFSIVHMPCICIEVAAYNMCTAGHWKGNCFQAEDEILSVPYRRYDAYQVCWLTNPLHLLHTVQ